MGQWSELPEDLLRLIEDCMAFYVDKVRIRAVCSFWNYCLPNLPNHKQRQFPLIFQVLDDNEDASHALFNPIEKKSYLLDLPELKGTMFRGSSHGWVVTIGDKDDSSSPEISLFNPLTMVRIKIPSRFKFPDVHKYNAEEVGSEYRYFMGEEGEEEYVSVVSSDEVNRGYTFKFVLSSPPDCVGDCFIAVIYGPYRSVAYCKLNDKTWTPLFKHFEYSDVASIGDMIYYRGKLHVLDMLGRAFIFEPKENIGLYSIRTTIVRSRFVSEKGAFWKYLVESSKMGLMMVVRFITDCETVGQPDSNFHTFRFKAYKVDSSINSSSSSRWVEVKDIGEDVLFVGLNSGLSISTADYPEYENERNHIYFTDHTYTSSDSDTGVFNLKDTSLQSLSGFQSNPKYVWPIPVWVNIG